MKRLIFAFLTSAPFAFSAVATESRLDSATRLLLHNIEPAGTANGVVVASPSRANPDYYYHWVRDSALVMDVIRRLSLKQDGAKYEQILINYANFSASNQATSNWSGPAFGLGLGEPKFHVDGHAVQKDWGRPQSDGPALRALTLIRFARTLMARGDSLDFVKARLYNSEPGAHSVIKNDLEYVSHQWRRPSYDLWEEFLADHFYNRVVQRRALLEGSELAAELGDRAAAAWYRGEAVAIEREMAAFFDAGRGYIVTMRNYAGGTPADRKEDGLDSGVILGVLHSLGDGDSFFGVEDDRVLATALALERVFTQIYPINSSEEQNGKRLAPAMGRYTKDQYDGYVTDKSGNPWFLINHAFAELYFRLATTIEKRGSFEITERSAPFYRHVLEKCGVPGSEKKMGESAPAMVAALRERGDQFLARSLVHAGENGAMAEQIHKVTGAQHGAADLTWSYASLLSAIWAR